MKQPTMKQQWARERNWTIGRIKGIRSNVASCLHKDSLTELEKTLLKLALRQVDELLRFHIKSRKESWRLFGGRDCS